MGHVEPDPLDEIQTKLIKHLREQHLGNVDADDEAGVALEIEMSRVIMVGAGGAVVLTVSKVFETTRIVSWPLFWSAEMFLLGALIGSWASLYLGSLVRRMRVRRKYNIYFAELNERVSALQQDRSVNAESFLKDRHSFFELENHPRKINGILRIMSALSAAIGILLSIMVMAKMKSV